jgi:hypothetical protein
MNQRLCRIAGINYIVIQNKYEMVKLMKFMKNAVTWDVEGTSVHTRSTHRHIPEDGILHSHRCENLKSYIMQLTLAMCDLGIYTYVGKEAT